MINCSRRAISNFFIIPESFIFIVVNVRSVLKCDAVNRSPRAGSVVIKTQLCNYLRHHGNSTARVARVPGSFLKIIKSSCLYLIKTNVKHYNL